MKNCILLLCFILIISGCNSKPVSPKDGEWKVIEKSNVVKFYILDKKINKVYFRIPMKGRLEDVIFEEKCITNEDNTFNLETHNKEPYAKITFKGTFKSSTEASGTYEFNTGADKIGGSWEASIEN